MVADTPRHRAILGAVRPLICLALNAQVHDVVTADRAVIHDDVPSPQCDSVPFLDLKSLRRSLPRRRSARCFLCHCTDATNTERNRS